MKRKLVCESRAVQLAVAAVLTIPLMLAAGCSKNRAHASGTESREAAPAVGITPAAVKPLERQLTVSSELVPFQEIDVYAKQSGYVNDLRVDYGTRAKKGDVMAVLEIPELEQLIAQDEAAIRSANDQVTHAQNELKRLKAQYDNIAHPFYLRLKAVADKQKGLIAQQEIDDAAGKDLSAAAQVDAGESALRAAESQRDQAISKKQQDQVLFDYRKISAPFSGVVTQRYANQGTLMQAGTSSSTQALPLVRLSEDDVFRLVIPVPESYVKYIKIGDPVRVSVPSLGKEFTGSDRRTAGEEGAHFRIHAGELGLTQKDIIDNVITALNSNYMIAPNYWVDYKTGNDYYVTVQYYEHENAAIHSALDLSSIPLRAPNLPKPTTLDTVVKLNRVETPTEIDHYKVQKVSDVSVTPVSEDLGKVRSEIEEMILESGWVNSPSSPTSYRPGRGSSLPRNVRLNLRGMVNSMHESFTSFGKGFLISFILLFLILVAQFRSFIDPFLIMLAIPMGFIGVLVILPLTHSTLNVMSLMGVLMLIGIADSNSILIVDFAHKLEEQGLSVSDAVITACRVRLRPILMTSLATIIGMISLALKLGTGAEQYAPMARAIIGGLTSSVLFTVFIVPAAYLLVYRNRRRNVTAQQ